MTPQSLGFTALMQEAVRDEAMKTRNGLTDYALSDRQRLIGSVKVRPFIPSLVSKVAHRLRQCSAPFTVRSYLVLRRAAEWFAHQVGPTRARASSVKSGLYAPSAAHQSNVTIQ
jgi:hypothetical protein